MNQERKDFIETEYGNMPYYESIEETPSRLANYEHCEDCKEYGLYYHVYTEKMIAVKNTERI